MNNLNWCSGTFYKSEKQPYPVFIFTEGFFLQKSGQNFHKSLFWFYQEWHIYVTRRFDRLCTHPICEVVLEHHIALEGIIKGMMKLQHLQQLLRFDRVEITVSESAHVGGALAHRVVVQPELIAQHVTATCKNFHTNIIIVFPLHTFLHLLLAQGFCLNWHCFNEPTWDQCGDHTSGQKTVSHDSHSF